MKISFSIEQLKKIVEPSSEEGGCDCEITGIAPLDKAGKGDLSFLGNPKYRAQVAASKACVLLVPEDFSGTPKEQQLFLKVKNPSFALARVCDYLERKLWPRPAAGVHPTAFVASSALVGKDVSIGPMAVVSEGARIGDGAIIAGRVYIGREASIGAETVLMPGVIVEDYTVIGERCRIQPGAVLGSEGYGYATVEGKHLRIPQVGRVVIGNDVDIGANATIDRARFSETYIGNGTKIDNLVQVGHNVIVGEDCLIVSQAGISGSTQIGNGCVIGGQVGIVGHIQLGNNVQVGGQSGVTKSVPDGQVIRGMPASEYNEHTKQMVLIRRLPDLAKRISKLEDLTQSLVNTDKQETPCK